MGKINLAKAMLGGLLAGLVLNIGEYVLHEIILAEDWVALMASLNREPLGGGAIAFFVVMTFVLGIALVWLYAAIRPRFGPGPKTAICAGLIVWFLIWFWSSVGLSVMGLIPVNLFLIPAIWGLFEVPIAALIGAWLYTEEG